MCIDVTTTTSSQCDKGTKRTIPTRYAWSNAPHTTGTHSDGDRPRRNGDPCVVNNSPAATTTTIDTTSTTSSRYHQPSTLPPVNTLSVPLPVKV